MTRHADETRTGREAPMVIAPRDLARLARQLDRAVRALAARVARRKR